MPAAVVASVVVEVACWASEVVLVVCEGFTAWKAAVRCNRRTSPDPDAMRRAAHAR